MTFSQIDRNSMSNHAGPSQSLASSRPQVLTRESAERLVNDLSYSNWPDAYSELCSKQPNLACVVSAIDQLLPHEEGEEQQILGYTIKIPEALRGHRKPTYSITIVRQTPQPPALQAPQQPGQSFTRTSLAFIQKVPWIGSRINPEQQAARPSHTEEVAPREVENVSQALSDHHDDVIRLLLKKVLTEIPNLKVKEQENDAQAMDISADAAERILQRLLGTKPATTSMDPELRHTHLLKEHSASNTKTTMSYSFRRDAITKSPALAEFYTAVGAALQIQIKDFGTTRRFNVPGDEDLNQMELERRRTEHGTVLYDTFCPSISRPAMDMDSLEDCAFVITRNDEKIPLEDVQEVIIHVFNEAKTHLLTQSSSEGPAENQRYPLMVYKTLAKALNLQVPNYLMQHEARLHQEVKINQEAVDQKALANTKRIAHQQALAEQERIEKEIRHEEASLQVSVTSRHNLSLAGGAAPPNSATNTSEYSNILNCMGADAALFDSIQKTLDASRYHQHVAYTARTVEALRRPERIMRDNRCWLRALWISAFSQIKDFAQIKTVLDKLPLEENPHKQHWPVLFNAILDDFKNRPNELLHRGENGGLLADAHFMTGLKVGKYLENKGIPTQHYDKKHFSKNVEDVLLNAAVCLAMGMRGEEKPRFDNNVANTKVPYVLMNSEFLVAVHRVMELPCLVVERSLSMQSSRNNQLSVIYSGPASDTDLRDISRELEERKNSGHLQVQDLQPLFEKYRNIPVLMLNADHYTLYLPKEQNPQFSPSSLNPPTQLPAPLPASHPPISHPPVSHSPVSHPQVHLARTESTESEDYSINTADIQTTTEVKTMFQDNELPLNANRIDFGSTGFSVVGQTPVNVDECILNLSKLLEVAKDNALATIFEFISPLAKVAPQRSRHPGMANVLNAILNDLSGRHESLEINGKTIVGLHKTASSGDPQWIDHYAIEYRDHAKPDQPKYAYITQAAPDFSNKFLTAEQLAQSYRALQCSEFIHDDNRFLLSAKGVGRSAALAVLDKAHVAIKQGTLTSPDQIGEWLEEAKAAGMRDRGQYFLAHPQQMVELHKAIDQLFEISIE